MEFQRCHRVHADQALQNKELLEDDLYLGNRHPRVRGKRYDEFIEKFITSARKHYPKVYLHCVGDQLSRIIHPPGHALNPLLSKILTGLLGRLWFEQC